MAEPAKNDEIPKQKVVVTDKTIYVAKPKSDDTTNDDAKSGNNNENNDNNPANKSDNNDDNKASNNDNNDAQSKSMDLEVKVVLKKAVGQLFISVFDAKNGKNFPDGGPKRDGLLMGLGPFIPDDSADKKSKYTIETVIKGLIIGDVYAIGLHHDIKKNGKFDTNFIGIPKDGYGASFPPDYNKWGKPTFDDCKFTFTKEMASKPYTMEVKYTPNAYI